MGKTFIAYFIRWNGNWSASSLKGEFHGYADETELELGMITIKIKTTEQRKLEMKITNVYSFNHPQGFTNIS